MPQFIGAIDQGTTSTRFIVVDEAGEIRAIGADANTPRSVLAPAGSSMTRRKSLPIRVLQLGRRWRKPAFRQPISPPSASPISAKPSFSGTKPPARRSILRWSGWTCERRARPTASRRKAQGDSLRARSGLPLATYFSALKIVWLLDNISGARARAERGEVLFGTMDSWLIWNLTGGPAGGRHVTDATNASRTQLMNLATLDWDEELLALFNVPRACLPEIRSSSEVYGSCVAPLSGVPIAGALGDQHAALLGQACLTPGDAKNTYGTGCFLLMNTGETPHFSRAGLLTTLAFKLGAQKPVYALEGSIAIAGALVQWLRDNLGIIESSPEIEALAASVPDNGDVYFVPAFSGLYAPRWRADARGVIAGLTRFSNKGHIARAALEAAAYQTREVLAAMVADSGVAIGALKVDGGMAANDLLMQFQADILDVPVVRPRHLETTALGAAYAAGLGVGFFKNVEEIAAHWRAARRFEPAMEESERARLIAGWEKAVEKSLGWAV